MTTLSHQVYVFNAGATSFSTGNVEFTLGVTLADAPTIPGPVIRPFEGRTEARTWSLRAVDSSGSLTAQLADSGGRMDLLNRWVQVRRTLGGTAAVVAGGRLQDVELQEDQSYRINVLPEVSLSKALTVFNTTNTTRIYPPGPHNTYGPFQAPPKGRVRPLVAFHPNGSASTFVLLQFEQGWAPMQDLGRQAIRDDKIPLQYVWYARNFQHLRVRYGNTDYYVASFLPKKRTLLGLLGYGVSSGFGFGSSNFKIPDIFDGLDEEPPYVIVEAAKGAFGTPSAGASFASSAFLHMFSAPPSEATPLHIGTSAGTHPMTLKRQLLNGFYASSDQPRPRYSTAAFNNGTTGLEKVQMPAVRFRITGPEALGPWMEDHLNAPNGVVDFVDSSGRIRPRRVWLPNSTSAFAFTFTGANLRGPHPSWVHPAREMVTQIEVNYTQESWVPLDLPFNVPTPGGQPEGIPESARPAGGAADFIRVFPKMEPIKHDRIARLGIQPLVLQADGVHVPVIFRPDDVLGVGAPDALDTNLDALKQQVTQEVFDRWGDGPISGTLNSLESASTVEAGDFARVSLATFPNPGIGARGGVRLVQVLSKSVTPYGPEFEWLDAGPNANALTAPTVTLALSTEDKKHSIKATVGSVSTAGSFQFELARSTGAAAPASTSALWTRVRLKLTPNTTAGVYKIGARPANSSWWGRVRATQGLRVRSSWHNSTGKVTTSGITAPTIVGTTQVGSRTLDLLFTPGDPVYPLQVFADTSTSASFSGVNLATRAVAGATRYHFQGLVAGTKYLLGVRHSDPWGGVSGSDSTTVTTASTAPVAFACQPPAGFYLIAGAT